jgi:hypothetical protein
LKTLNILAFTLALATSASAGPFLYNGPAASGVDTNPATLVNLNVPDFGTIINLSLTFDVSGGCPRDSNYSLFHNATLVVASPSDGGVCGANPSGTYVLSAFNGQQLNGQWQLQIQDVSPFPGEGNVLNSWSISGNVTPAPEPASMGLIGAGLLGLGLGVAARRRRTKGMICAGRSDLHGPLSQRPD